MIQFLRAHRIPLLIITILSLVVWHKILNQTILGEGYYYFDTSQDFVVNGRIYHATQYDNFARIFFDVVAPLFREHIILYLWAEMACLIVINLVFYGTVFKITENKWIAIVSVILFNANYMASYEMNAIGNYQRFIQRQPNIIVMFTSLTYLAEYFRSRKRKMLAFCIAFYTLGIALAHFSLFLMPIFVFFPLANLKGKVKVSDLLLSLTFLCIGLILVAPDAHHPTSLQAFLSTYDGIIPKILIQITNTALPPGATITFQKIFGGHFDYKTAMTIVGVGLLSFFLFIWFKYLKHQNGLISRFYLSLLASLPIMCFMNLWTYLDNINPYTQLSQARFYYIPSIVTSILWSVSIYFILKGIKNRNTQIIATTILIIYCGHNMLLINRDIDSEQYKSDAMKIYLSQIISHIEELNGKSTIVTSTSLAWPAAFINNISGHETITYAQFEPNWEQKVISKSKNNTFVYAYDRRQNKVLDLTQIYREGKYIDFTDFR